MEAHTPKAVFLSYASQDVEMAQRIADALQACGVMVWFDHNELRGGDAWDAKIRRQINDCALFVPLISRHTQERAKGYFRLEWKLAVDQTEMLDESVPFILPVTIDDVPHSSALVPGAFRRVQWMHLPDGRPTPQFVEQIRHLLNVPSRPVAATRPAADQPPADGRRETRRPPRVKLAAGLGALAVLASLGIAIWQGTRPLRPAATGSDKSIAVLPFENRSAGPETNTVFADGIHDGILTHLTNIRELQVISRTTMTQYRRPTKTLREIGAELGVAWVLEGSVQRDGNRVLVTARLNRAATDEHVWAKSYDRNLTDVFAIQAELSQAIASELKAAISPAEKKLLEKPPTANLTAYDLFLQARNCRDRDGLALSALKKQEALFQGAVELDPTFAAAWVELTYTHGAFYNDNHDHTPKRLALARAAVDTVIRLAPEAPETVRGRGDYYYLVERDYVQAIEYYQRFAQLQPNNSRAYYSLAQLQRRAGRWPEALANYRKAVQLDPANRQNSFQLSAFLTRGRRFDDAAAERRRILTLHAERADEERFELALLAFAARGSPREMEEFLAGQSRPQAESLQGILWRKLWAQCRGDFAEAIRLDRQHPDPEPDWHVRTRRTLAAATTLAATGDWESARARLADMRTEFLAWREHDPGNAAVWRGLAAIEALYGNRAEALRCIRQALDILPEAQDAYDGPIAGSTLAFVYAWTGDKDRALAEYARLLRGYDDIDYHLNVHFLKHSPRAFPLRDDPRFQALLNDPLNNAAVF